MSALTFTLVCCLLTFSVDALKAGPLKDKELSGRLTKLEIAFTEMKDMFDALYVHTAKFELRGSNACVLKFPKDYLIARYDDKLVIDWTSTRVTAGLMYDESETKLDYFFPGSSPVGVSFEGPTQEVFREMRGLDPFRHITPRIKSALKSIVKKNIRGPTLEGQEECRNALSSLMSDPEGKSSPQLRWIDDFVLGKKDEIMKKANELQSGTTGKLKVEITEY